MLPSSGRSDGVIYFRDGNVAYANHRTPAQPLMLIGPHWTRR